MCLLMEKQLPVVRNSCLKIESGSGHFTSSKFLLLIHREYKGGRGMLNSRGASIIGAIADTI